MSNKIPLLRIMTAMAAVVLTISLLFFSCKKHDLTIPPPQATFMGQAGSIFFVTGPDLNDTIPVGVTSVAQTDRTISFTVTSKSGAAAGTQYTLVTNTVTIPAGKAIGYLIVKGIFPAYDGNGRRDTLQFSFTTDKTSGITPSTFSNSYTLVLRGPCFEGDVDLNELAGDYNNTYDDDGAYGPYQTGIVPISTSGTTAQVKIQNLYDFGFADITVNIDWTDLNNRTLTFAPQNTGADGSIFGPSYAGQQVWLYPVADPGTFSACSQTFTINYQVVLMPANLSNGPEQTILSR